MNTLAGFLQSLKEGEKVLFILSDNLITGTVKTKYDQKMDCIELSGVLISGFHANRNMTIPSTSILAWGKEEKPILNK